MVHSAFTKEKLANYLLEATLIVFSVMLALFLDSVLEDRREERINELAGNIGDEIRSNLAIVNEWLPYHKAVIDEIDRYLNSDELLRSLLTADGIDYGRLMKKGLIQDFYSDSSWQLAQQSEITSRIEFEISQHNVNATLNRFSDFAFARQTQDPSQLVVSLRILRNLFQELSGQQDVLRHKYREALKAVDALEE